MKYLFLALILLSCYGTCLAEIYYVKQTGNDTANDGKSWSAAFFTLQKALEVCQYGDQIWVAEGTYKPTAYPSGITNQSSPLTDRDKVFEMVNGVKLYGGFSGDETSVMQRITGHQTILSGDIGVENNDSDNCYHVLLSINDDSTTSIDGFTITKGRAQPKPSAGVHYIYAQGEFVSRSVGAGMFFIKAFIKLNDTLFSDNYADGHGGGMANSSSSPMLINVTFSENWGGMGGGMANLHNSTPRLIHTIFIANRGIPDGGGMFNDNSSPILFNVVFDSNQSIVGGGINNWGQSHCQLTNVIFRKNVVSYTGQGGGMYNGANCNPTLKNVLFWANSAPLGGGITNESISELSLINVTFAENVTGYPLRFAKSGAAIFNSGGIMKIKNGIFWGNKYVYNSVTKEDDIFLRNNSKIFAASTLMQLPNTSANYPSVSFPALDSTHNIFAQNPLFIDAANGNLRLQDCSPAINAGDTTEAPTQDLDGNPRPYPAGADNVDMGAYENQTISWPAHLNITEPMTNGTVVKMAGKITATNQIEGARVIYQATKSITLLPDFSAIGNGFTAFIGGCETLITSETPAGITK
ncbi:hypothetical protein DR864_29385 (plasmid) [Runella rosea]|uniref:DUF1565 domain-containing protein n=1 Tax=Runella rosea TaxID=2259595 RepID=A0A344TTK9_9BACT|nr:3-coathanger stack domain-containing protein [Runella rosea]AXE21980.1 hypothetical protein DR864_29385 [Runella rosea]